MIKLLQYLICLSFLINFVHSDSNSTQNESNERCYGILGCFGTSDFADLNGKPITFLPQSPEEINITYRLYTSENPYSSIDFRYNFEQFQLNNSPFNPRKKVKFIIHGFTGSFNEMDWMGGIKDLILEGQPNKYNVFGVDWSNGAKTINYFQAVANTRVVGASLAHFINKLNQFSGLRFSDVHLIGHSLGAHICGYAGERIKNPQIGRITGLDPAGPSFYKNLTTLRLDPTDASYVDALHTDYGNAVVEGLGLEDPVGDIDYYPNGGYRQPACGKTKGLFNVLNQGLVKGITETVACNHNFAPRFMLVNPESLTENCQFVGYQCQNYEEFEKGRCTDCGQDGKKCAVLSIFGETDRGSGQAFKEQKQEQFRDRALKRYYYKTSDKVPYCVHHYGIEIQLANNSDSGTGSFTLDLEGSKRKADGIKVSETFSSFKPGETYTYLVIYEKSLGPLRRAAMKWSFQGIDVLNPIKLISSPKMIIERLNVKYLSNIDPRIRQEESVILCPERSDTVSSGNQLSFVPCQGNSNQEGASRLTNGQNNHNNRPHNQGINPGNNGDHNRPHNQGSNHGNNNGDYNRPHNQGSNNGGYNRPHNQGSNHGNNGDVNRPHNQGSNYGNNNGDYNRPNQGSNHGNNGDNNRPHNQGINHGNNNGNNNGDYNRPNQGSNHGNENHNRPHQGNNNGQSNHSGRPQQQGGFNGQTNSNRPHQQGHNQQGDRNSFSTSNYESNSRYSTTPSYSSSTSRYQPSNRYSTQSYRSTPDYHTTPGYDSSTSRYQSGSNRYSTQNYRGTSDYTTPNYDSSTSRYQTTPTQRTSHYYPSTPEYKPPSNHQPSSIFPSTFNRRPTSDPDRRIDEGNSSIYPASSNRRPAAYTSSLWNGRPVISSLWTPEEPFRQYQRPLRAQSRPSFYSGFTQDSNDPRVKLHLGDNVGEIYRNLGERSFFTSALSKFLPSRVNQKFDEMFKPSTPSLFLSTDLRGEEQVEPIVMASNSRSPVTWRSSPDRRIGDSNKEDSRLLVRQRSQTNGKVLNFNEMKPKKDLITDIDSRQNDKSLNFNPDESPIESELYEQFQGNSRKSDKLIKIDDDDERKSRSDAKDNPNAENDSDSDSDSD